MKLNVSLLLIMTYLLVLLNANFKLIKMPSSYLEQVTHICEHVAGYVLGISMIM